MKINVIFLLSICLLFATCKKKKIQHQYPEDPKTTTLTPRERLNAGWRINAYTFRENDIIPYLDTFYKGQIKIADVIVAYSQDSDSKIWLFKIQTDFIHESETAFNPEDPDYLVIDGDNSGDYKIFLNKI